MAIDLRNQHGTTASFTILVEEPDPGRVLVAVQKLAPTAEVIGPNENWSSIVVRGSLSVLTLNCMVKQAPGDSVSKILPGALNFFKRIKTEAVSNQTYVCSFILSTNILIGIVADPDLSEEDGQFDLIFSMADQWHGQIFNGSAMLNASGDVLLDDQGAFDIRI